MKCTRVGACWLRNTFSTGRSLGRRGRARRLLHCGVHMRTHRKEVGQTREVLAASLQETLEGSQTGVRKKASLKRLRILSEEV